jgi:hypothetical protein
MGKLYDEVTPELCEWIAKQRLFFVATAPLAADGHINCSPKGIDSFRVINSRSVGFLDLTGSGAETIAHLRENGRITIMFCAFEGPPLILRLYGTGRFVTPSSPDWEAHQALFPHHEGVRSIVLVDLTRIGDSCGFGVPKYEYQEERTVFESWARKKGQAGVQAYQQQKNLRSIDGLPALDPSDANG